MKNANLRDSLRAMRFRALLSEWDGVLKSRNPVEVKRIKDAKAKVAL